MNEAMLEARRSLGVKAVLTLPTGAVYALDGADVLTFSVEEGSEAALLPGGALSARLTLELANDAGQWRDRPLVGATAEVFVVCESDELPCGVFIIDSVSAAERSGAVKLCGSDSIASELAVVFEDALSYPATLQQVWEHLVGQTRYVWSGELPGGETVIESAPDWGGVTLRKAAGWIAQAAGCFVRADRRGSLEVVPCIGGEAVELGPEAYWELEDGFQDWGPVAKVQVRLQEESFTVGEGDGETVLVEGNPLVTTESAAGSMLAQIEGLRLAKAGFGWRGEPSVSAGSRVALTDTYGKTLVCTVTRQTMRFENGFSAQCVCSVPEPGDGGIVRAITPEGGLNAGVLVGTVDGGLLAAGSVTARSIAAKTITAEKLAAGSVIADHLDADTVSARVAQFVAAELEKLTAGEIETDRLYAALAHVVSLTADSVAAGRLDADQLGASLAEFVSMYAKTGEFDFATVQNLVSKAMALEQGAMDTVYIKNLAVTSANLLSATLGKLVLKGDDGRYYRVFVGSDGTVSTEEVADVNAEVEGGKQIVETSMNVADLNATNLQASSAVINEILTTALTAEKITAADALIASATIPALYTTSIQAIGNSLELLVGKSSRAFRSETTPAEGKPGDLWVQPSTGYTFQLTEAPEFSLDADGNLHYDGDCTLWIDADGNLYTDAEAALSAEGQLYCWQRVKDSELAGQISLRVEISTFEETTDGLKQTITSTYSELTQRADSVELEMVKKVDEDALKTYIRYENGTVELGRSDSRYVSQTSDSGFVVLQDGEPMTSMVQNTVSAPVIEARRQFVLGGFALRVGAGGHLLLV